MSNPQIILFCTLITIFTMVGCATLCKPPKVVVDTIEQEGAVLLELNSSLDTLSKEELRIAILTLIDSNAALKKYFNIKRVNDPRVNDPKEEEDEPRK